MITEPFSSPEQIMKQRNNADPLLEKRVCARSNAAIKNPGMDRGLIGAPGEIRTPDLLVRSQTLYPTELRAHKYMLQAPLTRAANYPFEEQQCQLQLRA